MRFYLARGVLQLRPGGKVAICCTEKQLNADRIKHLVEDGQQMKVRMTQTIYITLQNSITMPVPYQPHASLATLKKIVAAGLRQKTQNNSTMTLKGADGKEIRGKTLRKAGVEAGQILSLCD